MKEDTPITTDVHDADGIAVPVTRALGQDEQSGIAVAETILLGDGSTVAAIAIFHEDGEILCAILDGVAIARFVDSLAPVAEKVMALAPKGEAH